MAWSAVTSSRRMLIVPTICGLTMRLILAWRARRRSTWPTSVTLKFARASAAGVCAVRGGRHVGGGRSDRAGRSPFPVRRSPAGVRWARARFRRWPPEWRPAGRPGRPGRPESTVAGGGATGAACATSPSDIGTGGGWQQRGLRHAEGGGPRQQEQGANNRTVTVMNHGMKGRLDDEPCPSRNRTSLMPFLSVKCVFRGEFS